MGDCRDWRESEYKDSMTAERVAKAGIVFSARFAPPTEIAIAPEVVATASSNGRVALYSVLPPVTSQLVKVDEGEIKCPVIARPLISLGKHDGPAYDVLFYGEGENALLLSCGDDGHIYGWRWNDVQENLTAGSEPGGPVLELKNPQQKGPRSALSPIPETNALAADAQGKLLFAAAGDGCAYSWDMETQQLVTVFDGHSDYLHCIASRPSHNQIVTGSEDGTAVIWDCRSGERAATLDPWKATTLSRRPKERSPWVGCVTLDASENWLACGSGGCCVALYSLPGLDAVTRIATLAPPQAIAITNDEIITVGAQPHLSRWSFGGTMVSQVKCAPYSSFSVSVHPSGTTAVAGYGGLVDIISEFGSHLCTFRCQ